MAAMSDIDDSMIDRPLGFTIPSRDARGRMVRLGPVLRDVLSAHDYPPPIEKLLAEALVLAALLGTLLKEDRAQLTMQAQTEAGVVRLLAVDYRVRDAEESSELRGYVQFDAERLAELGPEPTLFGLFGKGYLAITFEHPAPGTSEVIRYQGIVPLEGQSLSDAAQHYFEQSEQLPTFIRVAVGHENGKGPDHCIAGGILVQHLPDGEEGRTRLHTQMDHPEWDHVRILSETILDEELIDSALSPKELIWRLFHEEDEVRVLPGAPLSKGCRCDAAHIRSVMASFPASEQADMADETGHIVVDCAFCSRLFPISLDSLKPN